MQLYFSVAVNALFFWLKIFIILLFIARMAKAKLPYLNMSVLVIAINCILLLAAVMYLCNTLMLMYTEYAEPDSRHTPIIARATGPYWWAMWFQLMLFFIIPQALWLKKLRASVKVTYTWWCFIWVLTFLEYYPLIMSMYRDHIPSSWAVFVPSFNLWAFILFLSLLAIVYVMVLRRRKDEISIELTPGLNK
jgi:hypothetical protein